MAGRRALLILGWLVAAALPATAAGQDKQADAPRIKAEPTCVEVQRAALAHFEVDNEKVRAMRRGASRKGAVPVFELSGGYSEADLDETTFDRAQFQDDKPWLLKGAGGTAWDARARMSWNLPDLVFNAEELDVASLAGMVQGLIKEVTRLYYMRRRLQYDLVLNPPTDENSRVTKELRLEEMTALLDALTGGWFQKELVRRGLSDEPGGPGGAQPAEDLFGK
ncbi:MAG: hypothetical protein FJ109_15900 [Deltaproteobacteria bacterium]|nr:hypothetical protein [Deltaproteobacteria bacterium]